MKRGNLLIKVTLVLLLIAVLGGCSNGGGESIGNNTYTLSGVILDENDNGINYVTISYTGPENNGSTETESDGSWQIVGLKGGVTLSPSKSGYTFHPPNLYESEENDNVNFTGEVMIEKTELHTAIVTVSNEEQLINYNDEVVVIIPGGMLDTSRELTISSLDSYPNLPDNEGILALYDVEIENVSSFSKEIAIEFSYDPDDIPTDMTVDEILSGVHWNSELGAWEEKAVAIDEERQVVILYTKDLSPVGVMMKTSLSTKDSEHFRLVYNTEITVGHEWNNEPEIMSDDLLQALEGAYTTYTETNDFLEPSPQWFQDEKLLVRLDNNYYESQWSWKTGVLFITSYYSDKDQLHHDLSHELFHAIQNRYFTFAGMHARKWWMEATADYAGAAICGSDIYEPIDENYFKNPISLTNGIQEYITANFINYLVEEENIDFKDLFDYITDIWSSDVIDSLDSYLTENTGKSFAEHYRNFARYIFFNSESPATKSPTEMAQEDEMPVSSDVLTQAFYLGKEGTASLWAVDVELEDTANRRYLEINLNKNPDFGVSAQIIKLNGSGRTGSPQVLTALDSMQPVLVSAEEDDIIYLLLTNTGQSDTEIGVTVNSIEPELTVDPESLDGEYDTEYSFNLQASEIPETMENVTFAWDFGDGETGDSQNLSQGEKTVSVQEGSAELSISHKYLDDGNFTLKVTLLDDSGVEIDCVEVPVTINLDLDVSITGARILIWELQDGATETDHNFEAVVQPRDTGEYRFEWDFDDGTTYSQTAESSSVTHLYTDLEVGDEFYPKVTLYSLDNQKLDDDSISIEVIEEQAEIVTFVDSNLEEAVRNKVNKQTGNITSKDMEEIINFYPYYSEISNLSGLEYAVNLEIAYLYSNQISDITPLAELIKLEKLWLYANEISSIQSLINLTSLKELKLNRNQISNISYLSELSKLEKLTLHSNKISDISPLTGLKNLNYLSLSRNQLTQVSLNDFPNLETLYLKHNEITEVNLSNLPNLDRLNLGNNNITSIDFLLDLPALTYVVLSNNPELITNDAHYHDEVYYPRSQAREVIETLEDRGVYVSYSVVNPY